jgi:hypothetical protein
LVVSNRRDGALIHIGLVGATPLGLAHEGVGFLEGVAGPLSHDSVEAHDGNVVKASEDGGGWSGDGWLRSAHRV